MAFLLIFSSVYSILNLFIGRRFLFMDKQQIEELRQHYIKHPPEGMTAKLVRTMTDSDLLDMHYFLIEDDDLEDDDFEDGFYVF